jgi:O-antigen ligase
MKSKLNSKVQTNYNKESAKKETSFSFANIFCILFLLVHFVPEMESKDPMGPQWFYVSIIDFICLGYIFLNIKTYFNALQKIYHNSYFIFFVVFLGWISLSYVYAINATETLVCLARVFVSFFAIISITTLFQTNPKAIRFLIGAIIVALTYESVWVLFNFYQRAGDFKLDGLVLSLYGNHGNKNIIAASIAIKIPFCLFFIYTKRNLIYRFLFAFVLILALAAIFILNTRSTYISIILVTLLYLLLIIYDLVKTKNIKNISIIFLLVAIPFLLALSLSNAAINHSNSLVQNNDQGYGKFADRVATIQLSNDASSGRIKIWKQAFDYFQKHTIIGCGFGNWKLASIPYDKIDLDTFTMTYHTHNDFIEVATEVGIVGVGLYISLFVILILFVFNIIKSNQPKENKVITLFTFLALLAYMVDASLNFPAERTIIQTLLVFVISIILFFHFEGVDNPDLKSTYFNLSWAKWGILCSAILLSAATYITYSTYKSLVGQRIVFSEFSSDPKIPLEDVKDLFSEIPNLSYAAFPLKQALARYYIREKDYNTAISLINESDKDNPYLFYGDFLKTYIYGIQGRDDSSYFYAKKSFYERPRTMSYYQNLQVIATKLKDTNEMKKAFYTFRKYRNEPQAWAQYIQSLFYLKGLSTPYMQLMTDSASRFFAKDSMILKTQSLIFNK